MKIIQENDANGRFSLCNAFAETYLGRLSGNAVKLYLYLKYKQNLGEEVFGTVARGFLHLTQEETESAYRELTESGLISGDGRNTVVLTADSKLADPSWREDIQRAKRNLESLDAKDRQYVETEKIISSEFFGGKMTRTWYELIERIRVEFAFEPEALYLLFRECRTKLAAGGSSLKYVTAVAENWNREGVRTAEDVAKREETRQQDRAFIDFVAKKVNFQRAFTQKEEETIKSWRAAGITEELLSVLLDDTNRVSAFTVAKINGEVEKWKTQSLTTPEQVRDYYEKLKKSRSAADSGTGKRESGKKSERPNTQTHFAGERKYDDAFFEALKNRDRNGPRNGGEEPGHDGGGTV